MIEPFCHAEFFLGGKFNQHTEPLPGTDRQAEGYGRPFLIDFRHQFGSRSHGRDGPGPSRLMHDRAESSRVTFKRDYAKGRIRWGCHRNFSIFRDCQVDLLSTNLSKVQASEIETGRFDAEGSHCLLKRERRLSKTGCGGEGGKGPPSASSDPPRANPSSGRSPWTSRCGLSGAARIQSGNFCGPVGFHHLRQRGWTGKAVQCRRRKLSCLHVAKNSGHALWIVHPKIAPGHPPWFPDLNCAGSRSLGSFRYRPSGCNRWCLWRCG